MSADDRTIRTERDFIEKYGEGDAAALSRLLPPAPRVDIDARALELAKAEHERMGRAMREHMPGHGNTIVTAWHTMSRERRNVMVAVWRSLLEDGIVT